MSQERGLTPGRWGFRCEWQQLNAVSRQGTLRAGCKYLWAGLCGQVKRNRRNQPCYDRHRFRKGRSTRVAPAFCRGYFRVADHSSTIARQGSSRGCEDARRDFRICYALPCGSKHLVGRKD